MKSSPTGLCFPLGVMGRQWTQDEFTTGRQHVEYSHVFEKQDDRNLLYFLFIGCINIVVLHVYSLKLH